jgi:hypothetical protein
MAEGGVGGASHPRRDRARKSALVLARDGSELVPKNRQGCARDVVDVGSVVRPERQLILLVSKAGSRPFVSFDSEVVWREPSDDVDVDMTAEAPIGLLGRKWERREVFLDEPAHVSDRDSERFMRLPEITDQNVRSRKCSRRTALYSARHTSSRGPAGRHGIVPTAATIR